MTNEELVQAYQNGDESAFERLVAQNKGVIGKVENKWRRMVTERFTSADEVHSECLFAFYQAAKDYRAESDCKFTTYASSQMDWRMNKFYRKHSPKKIKGVTVWIESLDAPLLGAEDLTLGETVQDEKATAELEAVFSAEENIELNNCLRGLLDVVLTPIENEVIMNHFGIGCLPCTLDQLALEFDCEGEFITAVKRSAMRKLRNNSEIKKLAKDNGVIICRTKRRMQSTINFYTKRARIC